MKRLLALCICLLWWYASGAQANSPEDTASINHLIDQAKQLVNTDPPQAISLSEKARDLSLKSHYLKGEAYALKNLGLVSYYKGQNIQTLEYWNESLRLLRGIDDKNGIANLLGNIGALYANQGDEVNALKYHLQSLQIAEQTGDKLRIFFALNNIGGIYFEKKTDWDKALNYLLRAYPMAEAVGNKVALGSILGNIGEIYFERGDNEKAKFYYDKALQLGSEENAPFNYNGLGKIALKQGNTTEAYNLHSKALSIAQKMNEILIVPSLQGLAEVMAYNGNYPAAINNYVRAEQIAKQQRSFPQLKDLYKQMAITYAKEGNYTKAFEYQNNLDQVKDTLFNEITQKKLGTLQFEFDLQKKEGEISLLTKDNALREFQLKKQRFAKNAFAVGLALVFLIAFILYRDNRTKIRINKVLDQQKDQIEHLLLNILPAEVAKELQTTGRSTPRSLDNVSVMFTDFKGFTTIAEHISAEELVDELNKCFIAFDNIIEKYGLEKIKTIGDSYMCAGGITPSSEDHVINIVKASLEIQRYIFNYNEGRQLKGLPTWEVRIGIHSGPVVAGVVGRKKYAYDIWGRTVNVASRMESSGIPGQVNVSSAIYAHIKDFYTCTYRGKIYAKNVGEIDMYLIERENESLKLIPTNNEEGTVEDLIKA